MVYKGNHACIMKKIVYFKLTSILYAAFAVFTLIFVGKHPELFIMTIIAILACGLYYGLAQDEIRKEIMNDNEMYERMY